MNTSVEKNSKKRKSLGGQKGTPAKAAKIDESLNLAKTAKSPKIENDVESNNVVSKSVKSPKKQIAPENKVINNKNGVSPKLNKFKGTKSLEGNKSDKSAVKQKVKGKKNKKGKKIYLLAKMKERVESEGKEAVIKSLNKIIDDIVSRPDLTNTGRRNLRMYKRILKLISGEEKTALQSTQKQEKAKKNAEKSIKTEPGVKANGTKQKKMPVLKAEVKTEPIKEEDAEESDDAEASFEDIKREEFEDDSDEEESGSDEEVGDEEEEDSDDDEEDDDDEDEEDEEEEKPTKTVASKKVNETKNSKPQNQKSEQQSQKKSRYILFIGNIAYDTTKEELKEHFKRVGEVVDVRIPTDKETNRPRGFAYVELANEAAYQKSLDMNGSQLKNRKIKVEYTQQKKDGEDRSKQIKSKNFKLHAMRKQGQKGSPNNKGQNRGSPFKGRNKK